MASCTSPRVSARTLPISRVMSRAWSSLRSISISAARKTISARRGAGTRRHLTKARLAASTAALTSSLFDFWKMPTRSRVSAGLRFSKVSPVEESTHSPSIKFLNTRAWLSLRLAGVAKVSVAMRSPCSKHDECPNLLMLQLAQRQQQARECLIFSAVSAAVLGVLCGKARTAELLDKFRRVRRELLVHRSDDRFHKH